MTMGYLSRHGFSACSSAFFSNGRDLRLRRRGASIRGCRRRWAAGSHRSQCCAAWGGGLEGELEYVVIVLGVALLAYDDFAALCLILAPAGGADGDYGARRCRDDLLAVGTEQASGDSPVPARSEHQHVRQFGFGEQRGNCGVRQSNLRRNACQRRPTSSPYRPMADVHSQTGGVKTSLSMPDRCPRPLSSPCTRLPRQRVTRMSPRRRSSGEGGSLCACPRFDIAACAASSSLTRRRAHPLL